eukprot:m.49759 g.49759  ORF g.49759 m.49759 type:complete len:324 (-) comp10628_c0_seq1:1472-2443(-)
MMLRRLTIDEEPLMGQDAATVSATGVPAAVRHFEFDHQIDKKVSCTDVIRDNWKKTSFILIFVGLIVILCASARGVSPCTAVEGADCKVFGDPMANRAQFVYLPSVYLVGLACAWFLEKPRRTLQHFVIDNMKQICSGVVIHFIATGFAMILHSVDKASECDWYIVIFAIDTVMGCTLSITLLAMTVRLASGYKWSQVLAQIGNYEKLGNSPSSNWQRLRYWLAQLLHWILICVFVRLSIFVCIYLASDDLANLATWLGKWSCGSQKKTDLKQTLNIVVIPVCLDYIQAYVQSFALKGKDTEKRDPALDSYMYNFQPDEEEVA